MEVKLNRKRCEAFGNCQQVAPAMYRLDDEGELHVAHEGHPVPSELEEAARAGARVCPVAALSIHE